MEVKWAHFGFRNGAFPQESDRTPKGSWFALGNVLSIPPLPNLLGLGWGGVRLRFPSSFITYMRMVGRAFSSFVLKLGPDFHKPILTGRNTHRLKPQDLKTMHPLILLLCVGAGWGGGETIHLSNRPPFQHLVFSHL